MIRVMRGIEIKLAGVVSTEAAPLLRCLRGYEAVYRDTEH